MTNRVTVTLPDSIFEQIQQMANASRRSIAEVLVDTVKKGLPPLSEHPDRDQMAQEVKAYVAMHAELLEKYPNEYVAIHQGKLVDHDVDLLALIERRDAQFPNEVVMVRQVLPDPEPVLHFRSPRLVRNGS